MFHSPTGYDSHHEKQEIGKFNQNINVIEKYVSRISRKIYGFFFFFMNPSLRNSVKNLPKNKFKCLSQEFNQNS